MATKTTKRSLLLSVVSLFICFTMLLGTTYAWFTDSVTSTGNIIKTGTLEVTLEYKTPMDTDWQDASQGAIFKYTNWEPGYTEVRYVKIENEGSLALKFMLNIIPNEQLAADAVDLAEVIDVYMVTGEQSVTRTDLDAISPVGTLASLMAEDDGAAHGILQPDENEVYTIVLKMQEDAGNEYQDISVGGGFVVQLLATQLAGPEAEANSETAETDDLGGDYDSGAEYPEVGLDNVTKEEGSEASVEADDVVVDIPAGAPAGDYALAVSDKTVVTDDQGNATVSMDIDLKCDGEAVDGNYAYTVSVDIGAGYNLTKLIHRDQEITTFDYNVATGIVTFTTNSFSPFSFVCEKVEPVKVDTPAKLVEAAKNGGVIELSGDVEVAEPITVTENLIINGNGYKLTYTGTNRAIEIPMEANGASVTIKNLTVDASKAERGINYNTNGTLTVENVTVTSNFYAINFPTYSDNATVSITDSTLTSGIALNIWGSDMEITVTNSELYSVENDPNFSYSGIQLNCDEYGNNAEGTIVTVNGGKLSATDELGDLSLAVSNWTVTGEVVFSDTTEVIGEVKNAVVMSAGVCFYTLQDALEKVAAGSTIILLRDIELDADETITIAEGVSVIIDLNGHTITGVSDDADKNDDGKLTSADNEVMIDVRGTLTVKNGTMTIKHESDNFGWNACTEIFYVGFNGTLNVENATLENLGGSDMAYAIDLVNAAAAKGVTLNIVDSTIKSSYIPVRIFNNGSGMNTVTINDTVLEGTSRALWVHIYSNTDNGGKGIKDATLNLDFFGNGNTFKAKNPNRIIEFGFDDEINFTADGALIKSAASQGELNSAVGSTDPVDVTLSEGAYTMPGTSGDVTISGTKDTVITVTGTPGGADLTFNGVTVKGSGYSTGVNAATVTYNNATIIGEMCLYREKVVFNNCTFELNGQYIWTYGAAEVEFNNCTFNTTGKAILIYNEGDGASKVTVKGCTFNATAGAKAGAISNQNCAAIEIDNFQSSGKGIAHELVTEGNTYSNNFSGEWRIKNYVADAAITVNGVAYTKTAVDGKLMTVTDTVAAFD